MKSTTRAAVNGVDCIPTTKLHGSNCCSRRPTFLAISGPSLQLYPPPPAPPVHLANELHAHVPNEQQITHAPPYDNDRIPNVYYLLVKPGRPSSGRETGGRQGKPGGGGGLRSGRAPRESGGGKENATAQPGGEGPGTQAGRRAPGGVRKGGRDSAAAGVARDAATGGCEFEKNKEPLQ